VLCGQAGDVGGKLTNQHVCCLSPIDPLLSPLIRSRAYTNRAHTEQRQLMSLQKARNATSTLSSLAQVVAIPADHSPVRMPTFPALERTSQLQFKDTGTVAVTAAGTTCGFLCRDPAMPLWMTQSLFGTTATAWSWFYQAYSGATTTQANIVASIACADPDEVYMITSAVGPAVAPLIRFNGVNYFYYPSGLLGNTTAPAGTPNFSVQITTDIASAPGRVEIDIELISIGQTVEEVTLRNGMTGTNLTSTATSVGFSINTGALVSAGIRLDRFVGFRLTEVRFTATAAGSVVSSICVGFSSDYSSTPSSTAVPLSGPAAGNAASVLWPVFGPTDYNVSMLPWRGTRATAIGVLFSNVSTVMSKEGVVNAGRVSTEAINIFDNTMYSANISTVHPKDRYFGAMENGLYTFTLPDSGSEVYRDCATNVAIVAPLPAVYVSPKNIRAFCFDLSHIGYANLFQFTDIDSANATTLAVQLDRHIEFRNTSAIFPVGFSSVQLETYHAAQMALVRLGVFFENPSHWSTIASLVKKAVGAVAPIVAPYAKQAAVAVGRKAIGYATKKFGNFAQAGLNKPKQKKQAAPHPPPVVRRKRRAAATRRRR